MRPPVSFIVLCALLCAIRIFPLDWPVEKRIITGTFGEFRGNHFHGGIDIGGGEQDVHPVLPGEIVFQYVENIDYSSLPRGVGSFIVLHHEGGLASVYCHLRSEASRILSKTVEVDERIGTIGDTGYSEGKHLHFMVIDEETSSFVNPLSLLAPVADMQPPVIKSVGLRIGDSVRPLTAGTVVSAGSWEILSDIYDLREDVRYLWTLAPYSVHLTLNGKEVSKVVFDSIQATDGRMTMRATRLSVEDVYARDGLMRFGPVELREGETQIIIVARDFRGNEVSREISFSVRE
jgi:hypothetical protein